MSDKRDRDLAAFVGKEKAEQITNLFASVYPVFHALAQLLNVVWPYVLAAYEQGQRLWLRLQPYHPLELSSAATGLFLAFFGGRYLLLMGAVEAARQAGWEKFTRNIATIYDSYRVIYEQNLIDNARDDDKNGVADVQELSRKDLFSRKFKLLLRTTDPDVLYAALTALWFQFMSIVVTLRVQFAQTLCLGAAIGEAIEAPLMKYLVPVLAAGIHTEYKQWVPFGVRQVSRFVGVAIAFSVQRVISGFYAAIKGGQLFAVGLLGYLVKFGHIAPHHETSRGFLYSVIVAAVFAIGFFFQLSTFFGLPFPLNLVMLPASTAENVLLYFVGSDVHTGQTGARS